VSRLITLYPATWRHRYEDEFLDLLEIRPPSIRDRVDIVLGALDAHRGGARRSDRIVDPYWRAVLAGFACFLGAIAVGANGPVHRDAFGEYRDGAAALPILGLAMLLLAVGLAHVVTALPSTAVAARRGGWTAVIAGPLWALMPWMAVTGIVFLVGLVLLAVGARRCGLWPWWSEVAFAVLVAVPTGLFAAMGFLPWYALRVSGWDLSILLVPIGALWPLLALLLRRGLPPVARA
jgi:hypothetical protein